MKQLKRFLSLFRMKLRYHKGLKLTAGLSIATFVRLNVTKKVPKITVLTILWNTEFRTCDNSNQVPKDRAGNCQLVSSFLQNHSNDLQIFSRIHGGLFEKIPGRSKKRKNALKSRFSLTSKLASTVLMIFSVKVVLSSIFQPAKNVCHLP